MINWLVKTFIKNPDDGDNPAVRSRYGLLSGCTGIGLNLLISAGKFVAGLITGSIAITADAFNNLSDAGSSVVTLVGFHMAEKDADDDHPFGHGRMEYLSGLIVALAILLVGVELGKSSLEKILHPTAVEFSWLSVAILLGSILVKLWMFYFNRSLGRRISSAALAATAADSISDVFTTSAVLLGILVSHFWRLQIDGWVGILVAAFILKSGYSAAKDTLDPLLGQNPDPAFVRGIQQTVLSHPEITGMHDLIIHDYGPGRSMLSLHAEVPVDADVLTMHDIIDNTERELKEKFRTLAVIHMDPIATHDAQTIAVKTMVEALVREVDPQMTLHDFRMTAGPHHTNLIFDVVAHHSCPLSDEAIKAAIAERAAALDGNFYTVVSVDHSYTEIPAP